MAKHHNLFDKDSPVETFGAGGLANKFGIPPFSILDSRNGLWQSRKAAWLALGIKSELGRGENLLKFSDTILQPDPKKRKKITAIPGGGTGKNSVYKFKTDKGYETQEQLKSRVKGEIFGIRGWLEDKKEEGEFPDNAGFSSTASGTSIFDPVLCELFYRWFVPKGGTILDPFAGGSVRGIIASRLGYNYLGTDIREEQVEANRLQAKLLCTAPLPKWEVCDARDAWDLCDDESVDSIFSCPPYVNLEEYSDDPRDISTLEWDKFEPEYRKIIRRVCKLLKPNRFAAFVVGEVRNKKTGACLGFVPGTIAAFQDAGLELWNDAVLITSVGSLALRTNKQFEATRKLGRCHQQVLVFCKGDGRKATAAVGNGSVLA